MSHLADATNLKKKYCIHEYALRYEQGTGKPFSVCGKCGHKRLAIVTEHNEIRYTFPSKRSEFKSFLERHQEMQDLPNWGTITWRGYSLPGREEQKHWCGSWYTRGCREVEKHSHIPHAKGKSFIKRRQRFCYRPQCEHCNLKWMYRDANNAAKILERYERKARKKAKHLALTPPWWDRDKPMNVLRKKAYAILKELKADGGCMAIQPFKKDKTLNELYESPHFHVIGFGWLEGTREIYHKSGWRIANLGPRDSLFASVLYMLSHAGIKRKCHTLTWFGKLSYSELKLDKEQKTDDLCPACNSKLEELYYYGTDRPPPDVRMEMYVNPEGWGPVNTRPKTEWSKQDRYDYVINQKLYYANRGSIVG